jgi:hypothetical protein
MSRHQKPNHTVNPVPPRGVQERRGVCRYSVVRDDAWLGWWHNEAFQSTAAKIIDISLRGTFLTVENLPPDGQVVWFRPPGLAATEDWVEARLVQARKKLFGPREVRLSFRKVLPYDLFKAVVYGPDAYQGVEQPAWVSNEDENRDWW